MVLNGDSTAPLPPAVPHWALTRKLRPVADGKETPAQGPLSTGSQASRLASAAIAAIGTELRSRLEQIAFRIAASSP